MLIVVVQPVEHRDGDHRATTFRGWHGGHWLRHALSHPLVRPGLIEVRGVLLERAAQMCPRQDQEVVEALAPHAAEEPLARRIGLRRADGRAQDRIPLASASRSKPGPYSRSLSRIRKRGGSSEGVASRRCWATQTSVGWRVTPTWDTQRNASAMTKKANTGRKRRSVTWRKSQAQISCAWLRTKVEYDWPAGRGGRVRARYRMPCLTKQRGDSYPVQDRAAFICASV